MPAELAVIVPTFNERDNVRPMLAALKTALQGIAFEVVFVDDDSDDGTAHLVRSIARSDNRVVAMQRIGRRGLTSAVVEGMMATSAPYLAVIDGDLQHDESILHAMLQRIRRRIWIWWSGAATPRVEAWAIFPPNDRTKPPRTKA